MKTGSRGSALPSGSTSDRPIKTYGADRTCAVCDTKLSRYNESGRCGVHRGWGEGTGRRATP
jgi:hypothetical protein